MKKLFFLLIFSLQVSFVFSTPHPDIVVDRNGRGDFRTIGEALESLKMKDASKRITVFIRNGFYKEKLDLSPDITNVRFVGESKYGVIINYDDHANINNMGTFRTYTFRVSGCDLLFENLTIENTAQQLGQAVALHLVGDRIIFRNCRFLGNQDTIYAGEPRSRHYFENCYIEGTTDFIFGPATTYFQSCEIVCKKNSYIAAANTPKEVEVGLVFNQCKICLEDGVTKVYLGRPWRPYAMTLFMNCDLGEGIAEEGWNNWRNQENEKTARYSEYNNKGSGAQTEKRVTWATVINEHTHTNEKYSIENVLSGTDGWNPLSIIH